MFVCRIIWRHKRSWLLWPGFFINLHSYNIKAVTRIENNYNFMWGSNYFV